MHAVYLCIYIILIIRDFRTVEDRYTALAYRRCRPPQHGHRLHHMTVVYTNTGIRTLTPTTPRTRTTNTHP